MDMVSASGLTAFVQVVLIDIALAADNAVVIGMAAAGLEHAQRRRAIFWGIIAATVMRIGFASLAVQLLQVIGLVLAGGILLLWVCWKMWVELHPKGVRAAIASWRSRESAGEAHGHGAEADAAPGSKTFGQAILQIVLADLSMSLDNVLAVAGAAREHPAALIFGLVLSIGLMGAAAMTVARLLDRHKWIAYLGFAVVFYVAIRMVIEGGIETWHWAF
jgi:YjbE family integral membrane protein